VHCSHLPLRVPQRPRTQHAATLNYLERAAPAVPGIKDELTKYYDRDRTDAPFFKNGREFFRRTGKG